MTLAQATLDRSHPSMYGPSGLFTIRLGDRVRVDVQEEDVQPFGYIDSLTDEGVTIGAGWIPWWHARKRRNHRGAAEPKFIPWSEVADIGVVEAADESGARAAERRREDRVEFDRRVRYARTARRTLARHAKRTRVWCTEDRRVFERDRRGQKTLVPVALRATVRVVQKHAAIDRTLEGVVTGLSPTHLRLRSVRDVETGERLPDRRIGWLSVRHIEVIDREAHPSTASRIGPHAGELHGGHATALTGIPIREIKAAQNRRELPYVLDGGRRWMQRADVEAWAARYLGRQVLAESPQLPAPDGEVP